MFPWLSILELALKGLPLIAGGIQVVLHFTGADRHRTIAGDLAKKLEEAARLAEWLHKNLMNGVQHGDPAQDPPT